MVYERGSYCQEPILWRRPEDVKTEMDAAKEGVAELKKEMERLILAYEVIEEMDMAEEETEYVFAALEERRRDVESELEEAKEVYLGLREQYEDSLWYFR